MTWIGHRDKNIGVRASGVLTPMGHGRAENQGGWLQLRARRCLVLAWRHGWHGSLLTVGDCRRRGLMRHIEIHNLKLCHHASPYHGVVDSKSERLLQQSRWRSCMTTDSQAAECYRLPSIDSAE